MTHDSILGNKLKKLRLDHGMTQDDVADLLDMNRTSFSKYENGAANPPLNVLRKLAKIYNVDLTYLIYNEETQITVRDDGSKSVTSEDDETDTFAQLTRDEKILIMKYRLLTDKEKEKIRKKTDK